MNAGARADSLQKNTMPEAFSRPLAMLQIDPSIKKTLQTRIHTFVRFPQDAANASMLLQECTSLAEHVGEASSNREPILAIVSAMLSVSMQLEDAAPEKEDLKPQLISERYAHVYNLIESEPEVKSWASSLASDLTNNHYVIVPNVLGEEKSRQLRAEVAATFAAGRLSNGLLGGGRSGKNTKYVLSKVRGDHMGWFKEDPCHDETTGRTELPAGLQAKCWQGAGLKAFASKLNTIVQLVSVFVPELQGIETRSEAMVTCYPGDGAHYVRHVDNPNRNGRKLTVVYYLNHEWKQGDGGELRVYRPARAADDASAPQQREVDSDDEEEEEDQQSGHAPHVGDAETHLDFPPYGDAMIMFFSDGRVPHEVLPAHVERFAVTHWFYDATERETAERQHQGFADDVRIEEERLQQEIAKFERETAETASVTAPELTVDESASAVQHQNEDLQRNEEGKKHISPPKAEEDARKQNQGRQYTQQQQQRQEEVGQADCPRSHHAVEEHKQEQKHEREAAQTREPEHAQKQEQELPHAPEQRSAHLDVSMRETEEKVIFSVAPPSDMISVDLDEENAVLLLKNSNTYAVLHTIDVSRLAVSLSSIVAKRVKGKLVIKFLKVKE